MKSVSAKFGNNSNDGTSKKDSYLTLGYAWALDTSFTLYSGVYFENNLPNNSKTITGVGKVIFDGTIFNYLLAGGSQNTAFNNVTLKNFTAIKASSAGLNIFSKCFLLNIGSLGGFQIINTVLKSNKALTSIINTPTIISNSSIYGTSGMLTLTSTSAFDSLNNLNVIIHSKPITFSVIQWCTVQFWHFYSVPITIGAITKTYDGSAGNTITDLRNAAVTAFNGVASDYFQNCYVYNASTTDCFVDSSVDIQEGFYLEPTSPSAKANYVTGKHIGAMPVARGPVWPTDYTRGSNIAADGTIINTSDNTEANNTIEYTNAFDHSKVILVEQWGEGIQDAPRNGDYSNIDRDTDIDANLRTGTAPNNTLTNGEVYVCEVESLSITNGATTKNYAVGENCYVPAAGTWTVVATNGVMRKLLTDKPQVIMVKHSRNDATLATANYLRYYVRPQNSGVDTYPMCHVDANGIPVLGDADTGFTYGSHATYGAPVRVQLRYEKRKSIMQLENAKS